MSRCFPYPPPGYSGKSASNEALIESIKLQREREKAKAERKKEKKWEKKEKKREKKEKKRGETEKIQKKSSKRIASTCNDKKTDDQAIGIGIDPKVLYKEKGKEVNTEPLERSSLSEEHDPPVVKPSYSSESTQNSNKRKRDALPTPSCGTGGGKVIKIRLPLQREVVPEKEPKCPDAGRTEVVTAQSAKHTVLQDLGSKDEQNRLTCSTSKRAEAAFFPLVEAPTICKEQKRRQKLSSRYEKVIRNWVPPPLHSSLFDFGNDQDDWLSSKKHQEEEQVQKNYTLSCASSDLLQPRAQFLPHVNVYAMPYTVPF